MTTTSFQVIRSSRSSTLALIGAAVWLVFSALLPLWGDTALLREFVESGVVEFRELADLAAALGHVERASETSGSEVVWIADKPLQPTLEQGSRVRAHTLAIGETKPRLWLDGDERVIHDEGWLAYLRVFQDLLAMLV